MPALESLPWLGGTGTCPRSQESQLCLHLSLLLNCAVHSHTPATNFPTWKYCPGPFQFLKHISDFGLLSEGGEKMVITQIGSALWAAESPSAGAGLEWESWEFSHQLFKSEAVLQFSSAGGTSPGVGCFLKHGMISSIFCCEAGEHWHRFSREAVDSAFGDIQIPGALSIPPCLRLVLSRRFLNGL